MFDSMIYAQRRQILKENINQGLILFLGNDETPCNIPENPYIFRQHSSFLYYWGIDRPGLAAVIDIDNNKEILFGDEYTFEEQLFIGAQPSMSNFCSACGVAESLPMVKLYTILREANAAGRNIHFLPPYRPENKIKILRLLNIRPDQFTAKSSEELVKKVVAQREIKSAQEIAELDKAVNLSIDMHEYAMRTVKAGMTEMQVAAQVAQIAAHQGAALAYDMIATVNGEFISKRRSNHTLNEGHMFLLDAAAETKMHYAADISSTFPVSSRFSTGQKEIYQIVRNAQNVAVQALKPGIEFKQVHFEACRALFDGLKQLGLTKGDTDEAVAEGAHALFLPIGIGHMIGIDIHDMEDLGELNVGYKDEPKSAQFGLKSLRLAKELKEGFTVSVEPGIYFIPALIHAWKKEGKFKSYINYAKVERYIGFGGIRNEENYVITPNGSRLLGRKKPSDVDEIENLRSEAYQ
jgi:Xaa-Pro aminopeptidase